MFGLVHMYSNLLTGTRTIQERLIYVVKPLILCEVILSRIMIGVVFINIGRLYLIHLLEKSCLTRLFRIW